VGKTPKPLRILVHPDLFGWPEIRALVAQGHHCVPLDGAGGHAFEVQEADVILAPNAWRMTDDLREYLPLAIKAARKQRYPKEAGDEDTHE